MAKLIDTDELGGVFTLTERKDVSKLEVEQYA